MTSAEKTPTLIVKSLLQRVAFIANLFALITARGAPPFPMRLAPHPQASRLARRAQRRLRALTRSRSRALLIHDKRPQHVARADDHVLKPVEFVGNRPI